MVEDWADVCDDTMRRDEAGPKNLNCTCASVEVIRSEIGMRTCTTCFRLLAALCGSEQSLDPCEPWPTTVHRGPLLCGFLETRCLNEPLLLSPHTLDAAETASPALCQR